MKENIKEELKKKVKIKIPFSEVEKKMAENFLELSILEAKYSNCSMSCSILALLIIENLFLLDSFSSR